MARKPYVLTPARQAHLKRLHDLNRKRGSKARASRRRHYGNNPVKRGIGVSGLKKNTVPYARINQNSQTAGFNTGTIIPFIGKRVSFGGYVRVENKNKGSLTKALSRTGRKIAPSGTKAGQAREWFNNNVQIDNPAIRARVGGSQVRLGTSRSAGPTIIVRRGSHKTPQLKSRKGVKKYNTQMKKIKKTRRARRGK